MPRIPTLPARLSQAHQYWTAQMDTMTRMVTAHSLPVLLQQIQTTVRALPVLPMRLKIIPVTVLGPDGTGQDSDIISDVVWAADHGADVILMGFSNPGFSSSLQDAIDYAWEKGAVLVAATGNDASNNPTFPAGDRGVIGVSATDNNADHRFLFPIGPCIKLQQIIHPLPILRSDFTNTPHQLAPGLAVVFLK